MKVMVMVKANKDSEAGRLPGKQLFEDMIKFNEQLAKAGMLEFADGLRPSSKGVRVKFSGKERTVIDGPFAETKELIAGFWIWKVNSMQQAIDWLKRAPFDGGEEVEIRQFHEPEDFAALMDPDQFKREQQLRDEIGGKK